MQSHMSSHRQWHDADRLAQIRAWPLLNMLQLQMSAGISVPDTMQGPATAARHTRMKLCWPHPSVSQHIDLSELAVTTCFGVAATWSTWAGWLRW